MDKTIVFISCVMVICVSCTTKQIKEEQLTIQPSQVIYHDRLEPQPLNEEQIIVLSENIKYFDIKIKDIWFCRVLYNNGDLFTVDTYFRPTESSQRILKGKYLRLSLSDLQSALRPFGELPDHVIDKYFEMPDYIYVSDKNLTASEMNDIPPIRLLPFESPEGFTDQEIVEIVDFVRSSPQIKREDQNSNIIYQPDKIDSELSIHFIKKQEDGTIEVQTGTQEGPLAGSGEWLTIKKSKDGYELITIGVWFS